ncbi:MAG: ATP-binding protein [Sphingobacterium sp.]|jgi:hypothetical protein|nr:ATP-binding protein [Sphingobacterium sp.]
MNNELFQELVKQPEGINLDFKLLTYDFKKGDEKFIKDILSFANTIRTDDSYIIFGVENCHGINNLIGVNEFQDDAILQQKVKNKVWPKPIFSSRTFEFQDKVFGIIKIPIHNYERPLTATQNMKGIEVDTVYVRNGSSNAVANASEVIAINQWMRKLSDNPSSLSLENRLNILISDFADTNIPLSYTIGKANQLSHDFNDKMLNLFLVSELLGYSFLESESEKFEYRKVRAPSTPYEIQIPSFGRLTSDQMIEYMTNRDEFREIDFFFSKSIFEIESYLKELEIQPKLLILKYANNIVFEDVVTDVQDASIYFSYQMVSSMYEKIRRKGLEILLGLKNLR